MVNTDKAIFRWVTHGFGALFNQLVKHLAVLCYHAALILGYLVNRLALACCVQ